MATRKRPLRALQDFEATQRQRENERLPTGEALDIANLLSDLDSRFSGRLEDRTQQIDQNIQRLKQATGRQGISRSRRPGEFTFPQTQKLARQQELKRLQGLRKRLERVVAPPGTGLPEGTKVKDAPTTVRGQPAHELQGYQELQSVATAAANEVGVPLEWARSPAFIQLIQHESSWNPNAANPNSSAFGLGQFLRSTWENYLPEVPYGTADPFWQLIGTFRYIKERYGSPEAAWDFWQRNNYY